MEKNDPNAEDAQPKTIEAFLRERERIDHILQKEFTKETTILFTDICGYTEYTDKRGDLSGRAMLQKHNDILFPIIRSHDGKIIKTIGDAIMAVFSSPLAAVRAASNIQNALHQHNLTAADGHEIHVKIGINTGNVLMDGGDVFGDAVNTAARIESKARADQILVSVSVYDEACGSDEVLCRFHKEVQVKGKPRPIQLYRVVWKDEDVITEVEPKVRFRAYGAQKEDRHSPEVLHVDVTREGNRIKLSVYEQKPGEVNTIQHYEETGVSMDWVDTRCREMVETLNKVNRNGLISRENLEKLREIGQVFSDELFTLGVKEKLKNSRSEHMILNLDDQLVHVPWELLYDGRQFLCQKFSMGRLVKTRRTLVTTRSRHLSRPLKMLVLADPGGDLKGAYDEGARIRDIMDLNKVLVNATLRSGNITPNFIKEKIRNFDFIHFAGHSDYDPQRPGESGWRLTGGSLKASDIEKMAGTGAMPALIFSNACQSARTEEWGLRETFEEEIFGMANVFLLAGVKHYVGTFWEIMDEPGARFATEFYKCFMSGATMGEAVRKGRQALIRKFGEENMVWASYLLYGDPTSNYMEQIKAAEPREEPEACPSIPLKRPPEQELRSREDIIDFSQGEEKKRRRPWMAVAAGIILIASALLWGYPGLLREGAIEYERATLAYYNEGDFDKALDASRTLETKKPDAGLAYLIQGDIYFRRGDLDAAEAAYGKAAKAKKGTDFQKAEALMGLGRIASIRKQTDKALGYYQSAAKAAPESDAGYLSQALLLEDKGEYGKALNLFVKARQYAPDNQVLASLIIETRKKAELASDQNKQDRIDQMVRELIETAKSSPTPVLPDAWSSVPLTLWVMNFETRGYSLQEGAERLLVSGIEEQLLLHSRFQLVERTLLDQLLKELKLGTSTLVDKQTALSLGRILAAKLILFGQVVYSGPQTQVSMRLIETETGRITVAVNETFGSVVPASVLSVSISKKLLESINKQYPLRGKISEVEGKQVRLDIGQMAGTRKGQRFDVVGEEMGLEVVSDQPGTSIAKVVKGEGPLKKGMRVEAHDFD